MTLPTASSGGLNVERYAQLLRVSGLFREFDDVDLEQVLANARIEDYPAGVDIVREGESGEKLLLLCRGYEALHGDVPGLRLVDGLRRVPQPPRAEPKKDWKLNDMMGATTWTYPAVHQAFRDAYEAFLAKT